VTAGIFCAKKPNGDERLVSTPSVTGWLIGAWALEYPQLTEGQERQGIQEERGGCVCGKEKRVTNWLG